MQNEIVSGQRSLSAPAATFSTSGRSLPADVLPHSLHSSALILRPCAGPLPRSHVPARSCQNRMSEWHRLHDPVRTPTPLPLGRYRGIPLSRSFVRIGCSGFAVRPGEEGRDSRLPLQICGLIARRGEHFRRVILSKPIYFSAPEVELYIGLSSFYEIFNPWEMNLNITSTSLH